MTSRSGWTRLARRVLEVRDAVGERPFADLQAHGRPHLEDAKRRLVRTMNYAARKGCVEDNTVNVEVLTYCKETPLTKCGSSLCQMVGLPFSKEKVETRQPLNFAPVNPADFAPADDIVGSDSSQGVRPAQAGAKSAAVAKKVEERKDIPKPIPLDSYGRNEAGASTPSLGTCRMSWTFLSLTRNRGSLPHQ